MIGTLPARSGTRVGGGGATSLSEARDDAGLGDLNRQRSHSSGVVVLVAILVGYFFAIGISGPVAALWLPPRHQPRRIHQRSPVRGASEIRRAGPKLQQDGRRHRETSRTEAPRRKSRTVYRLDPHACGRDRRKDPTREPFRPRGEVFAELSRRELKLPADTLDKPAHPRCCMTSEKIGVGRPRAEEPGSG